MYFYSRMNDSHMPGIKNKQTKKTQESKIESVWKDYIHYHSKEEVAFAHQDCKITGKKVIFKNKCSFGKSLAALTPVCHMIFQKSV